jgi:chromosome segregation protein
VYLKRMELFGFKSFADKSELGLNPGIAAVIGPNGCGKSNIVDAVRWALGEQSVKSLRGTRMEEIIFSGSDSRKALNFAEVSLTFAEAGMFLNLDYDEISITRRLFRNGDSEYYINKSPCRLKDITELFIDTGLGKDVYSVIGQGRVDEIINSRPEERREIFEEAAGILKYKLRKKEARRRLDETRENLVRVQDLIYELETQIEPLQEQAEITRQYRALQQRIESEEKNLLSFNLKHSREQLTKVNKQLQSVNDALIASAAEEGLHETEILGLKNSLQDSQNEKKEYEQKLNQVSRNLEQKESELRLLLEREKHFEEQLEQNRQRLKQLDLLAEEYKAQKQRAEQDLQARKKTLEELQNEHSSLQQELDLLESGALSAEVEKKQEELYKTGVRKEAAASAIEELKRRLEQLDRQKKAAKEEESVLLEKSEQVKEDLAALQIRASGLKDQLAAAEARAEADAGRERKIRQTLEKLSEEEQKKKEALYGMESRLNLLQEQDSALSGYYRGVRELMQAGPELPGIIGPVADLIKVDGEYVQAIESALGGSLQYLVAESESAVQKAIRYLKSGNRGWATFLPLDILHQAADPLERHPGWRDLPGVVGKASELVEADSLYRKAVDYLMSSILVCRDLDDASRAARFIKYSCRVVTLEGEMINPGGVIRGGSLPTRNAGMPLGRRKEIEELQAMVKELELELQKAGSEINSVKAGLADAEKKVAETGQKKESVGSDLAALLRETEEAEREQKNLDDRISSGRAALSNLEKEEAEINERLNALKLEKDQCSLAGESLEKELAGVKEDYRQFLGEKNALEQKITAALVKISSYREQHDTLISRIAEIEKNTDVPEAEKAEKNKDYEKYRGDLNENREARKQVAEAIENLNAEKGALIGELENKTQLVNKIEADLIDLEEQGRRRQAQVSRQEKRERHLSMEQTRLQTEISYQEIRFREQFQTLELAVTDSEYSPEESRLIVANLKEDLETLGEVNLGAIEELARLEDRINFLTEQKDDLHKGEASLHKVLAEIDQRMEFYFKKAFEQINENFQQTFQELFEGGQVMLKLTDSSNILESGIEIAAQPPGKKLQNITLLSAGEKVLTAIALVFAILRFKPAPFYLLDEVESTLDDANLARFTRFLKQTAKQAQFILITHRKRTMEEAEVLYGVTMPEPGVSRLVSINLEKNVISRES